MKVLKNAELLNYLTRFQIPEVFDTPNLSFRLVQYSKGEILVSPGRSLEHLLFLVDGTVYIYGLRQDDSFSPVAAAKPLTLFGDVEFATGRPGDFFVEAKGDVLCVTLSLPQYQGALHQDVHFLNWLLDSLGQKLNWISTIETAVSGLEERVLFYLKNHCPDGCIHSVNSTTLQLRCSRRQLQRVLHDLCASGQIEKLSKGTYRLK